MLMRLDKHVGKCIHNNSNNKNNNNNDNIIIIYVGTEDSLFSAITRIGAVTADRLKLCTMTDKLV